MTVPRGATWPPPETPPSSAMVEVEDAEGIRAAPRLYIGTTRIFGYQGATCAVRNCDAQPHARLCASTVRARGLFAALQRAAKLRREDAHPGQRQRLVEAAASRPPPTLIAERAARSSAIVRQGSRVHVRYEHVRLHVIVIHDHFLRRRLRLTGQHEARFQLPRLQRISSAPSPRGLRPAWRGRSSTCRLCRRRADRRRRAAPRQNRFSVGDRRPRARLPSMINAAKAFGGAVSAAPPAFGRGLPPNSETKRST